MSNKDRNDYVPQIVIGIVVTVVGGLVLSFVQGWLTWPSGDPSIPQASTPQKPAGETRVFLDKLSGPAGTTIHVSGEGFAAGETVTIRFHTEVCAETTADDSGAFSEVSCTVPPDWQFKMQAIISASGASSVHSGQAAFRVT